MSAAQLAKRLGGDVIGKDRVLCPGPGHSKHDRSLSVLFSDAAPDGFVCKSFTGDSWRDCRDHVRAALGNSERQRTEPAKRKHASVPAKAENVRLLWKRLWNEAGQIHATVAERYLESRKLTYTPVGALRFHPSLRYEKRIVPGIVALFRDITSNEPCGIHRTFLTSAGEKLDRKMWGRAKGAAIKLDDDENVTNGLTIGEGIETCIAARLAGFRPCWALGSAGAISDFPVLAGIEALTILGETDNGGANARAAEQCATRWVEAGREVAIVQPACGDLNDAWRAAN